MRKIIACLFALTTLCGCTATPSMPGYNKQKIMGESVPLLTFIKPMRPHQTLRIYIDGDANTGGIFSKHPQIDNDIALQLAKKDPYPYVAYLGRPCYYLKNNNICKNPAIWREGRFMPEVIEEMSLVISKWQKRYQINRIEFIGYDGGAAVAMLLATRLKNAEVVKIVTIGGVLNTDQYALHNDEVLLAGSLNPNNERLTLARIPQIHYVGQKDNIVPAELTMSFIKSLPNPKSIQIRKSKTADHVNWLNYQLKY